MLILDNFEQVVEHGARTVGRWRERAPEVRFLVTSRERLKLQHEEVLSLGPLPEDDGVELFETRAMMAGATWSESEENRATIAQLVRACDGLPLAIELAAARAQVLTPKEILKRLSERFELLRSSRRDVSPRQATLRGTLDWSWDLLEPWEQSAMAQFTVFHGGFFMEAAEEVLDLSAWPEAPWSLDVVGSLLDKSLLRSWQILDQPRFGMYVSVREYAVEKLEQAPELEAETLSLCAAAYYARFGTDEYRDSLQSHGGVRRFQFLTLELENLLAGVESGLAGGEASVAGGCALAAHELFNDSGPLLEGAALLSRVLEPEGLDPRQRSRLLGSSARLLRNSGKPSEAFQQAEAALALSRELGDRRYEGIWLGLLGSLHREQSRLAQGLENARAALAIAREVGDRRSEGHWLGTLGHLNRAQGNTPEAMEDFEAGLTIAQELGNRRLEGIWLGALGQLQRAQGNIPEAMENMEAGLAIAREMGNRRAEAVTLGNLGQLHRNQGRIPEAREHAESALTIARELGARRSEGIHLGNLGDLLIEQGEWEAATEFLERAILIGDETLPLNAGAFRGSLALVRARAGDIEEARLLLARGDEQVRGAFALELGKLLCKRCRIELDVGEITSARGALAEAEAIADGLGVEPHSELGKEIAALRELVGD